VIEAKQRDEVSRPSEKMVDQMIGIGNELSAVERIFLKVTFKRKMRDRIRIMLSIVSIVCINNNGKEE
jgi:hypothetical protein